MGYPAWPLELPQEPMMDGFDSDGQQPVRRQQMESGLDRVTRVSSTTARSNSISFALDASQLATFWSFYDNAANGGADFVLMPMVTGNSVAMHVCRIASYPKQSRYGIHWRVSFSLETAHQHIDWS